jgi:hypothetical protein
MSVCPTVTDVYDFLWTSTHPPGKNHLFTMMGRAILLIVALALFALSVEVCLVMGWKENDLNNAKS